MKRSIRSLILSFSSFLILGLPSALAFPLLSSKVSSINGRVMFFQDHLDANKYWYVTTAIDPVPNLDGSISVPVIKENQYLYFAYSGQAKVIQSDVEAFAQTKHIDPSDISPIPFDHTENGACMNLDASKVRIQIPQKVGSYLEHVPVSVYTTDAASIDILTQAFANGSGVNCSVDTYFKGVSDQYVVDYEVNMNDLFEKFQANLHGEFWFFETDINAALKKYAQDGSIVLRTISDTTLQKISVDVNDPSQKAQEMFMGVFDLVKAQLFVRKTSIPDTGLLGRGKAFSLRTDYQRSSEHFAFKGRLNQQAISLYSSEIQVRVAALKK